jgi:hypothetical protein
MSSSIDHYRADLALRLNQGPIRSSPFEYRRPSQFAGEAPDYRARPLPERAAPRIAPETPETPEHSTLPREFVASAIGVPPGARKGVEQDAAQTHSTVEGS